MKGRKKRNSIFFLLVLVLGISIGFALLSTTLKINGTTNINKHTWDIYWDSVGNVEKTTTATVNQAVRVDPSDNTLINFNIKLNKPGDFYEFQVDAVNNGSLDAMVDVISTIINDDEDYELPDYVVYTMTYADDTEIEQYDLLRKKTNNQETRKRYKIRIEYSRELVTNNDVSSMDENGESYEFDIKIPYVQADSNVVDKDFFATASWNEIKAAYNNGNPSASLRYALNHEVTRKITLGGNLDGVEANLRIANLSNPEECENSSFSESSCGFVIEFKEIVTTHKMNYYNTNGWAQGVGEGSWGGWEHSDMRAYLNGGTYQREHIDYSSNSFISTLPSDLRNAIVDTKVTSASAHAGSTETSVVTDKLYLLSATELYGKNTPFENLQYDLLSSSTRQLDYYYAKGVIDAAGNYPPSLKTVLNPENQQWSSYGDILIEGIWGTRSVFSHPSYDSGFYNALNNGTIGWTYSSFLHGVSPAFRLG